jgi:adenine-specific DNA-methyltransferase
MGKFAPLTLRNEDLSSDPSQRVRYNNLNTRIYTSLWGAKAWLRAKTQGAALYNGDCTALLNALPEASIDLVISSPPYCMGKEYEPGEKDVETFKSQHREILPLVIRALKPGASLCWQVGYHLHRGVCTPLDYVILREMEGFPEMLLRNRIAWVFGHGLHASARFSGRHETALWFTKGSGYEFDLNAVRVTQKYPGKLSSRGPNKGKPSGNPGGKNPGDVWDMPNVKANHVEKTDHPCQFPVGLAQRFVRALTKPGDVVLDPFCGVASSGVAAVVEGRRFLGAEISTEYVSIARERLCLAARGELLYRPADRAVHVPSVQQKVSRRPDGFAAPLSVATARRSASVAARRA